MESSSSARDQVLQEPPHLSPGTEPGAADQERPLGCLGVKVRSAFVMIG